MNFAPTKSALSLSSESWGLRPDLATAYKQGISNSTAKGSFCHRDVRWHYTKRDTTPETAILKLASSPCQKVPPYLSGHPLADNQFARCMTISLDGILSCTRRRETHVTHEIVRLKTTSKFSFERLPLRKLHMSLIRWTSAAHGSHLSHGSHESHGLMRLSNSCTLYFVAARWCQLSSSSSRIGPGPGIINTTAPFLKLASMREQKNTFTFQPAAFCFKEHSRCQVY